jgi:hypothetical protein
LTVVCGLLLLVRGVWIVKVEVEVEIEVDERRRHNSLQLVVRMASFLSSKGVTASNCSRNGFLLKWK